MRAVAQAIAARVADVLVAFINYLQKGRLQGRLQGGLQLRGRYGAWGGGVVHAVDRGR